VRRALLLIPSLLALLALPAAEAFALTLYRAYDAGAGPTDARPNADAAAAMFDAAAGAETNLIDFESVSLSTGTGPFDVGFGTTAQIFGDALAGFSGITNTLQDVDSGYNTTGGGQNFLRVSPSGGDFKEVSLVLSFDDPVGAWGAYITDVDAEFVNGQVAVEFDDGTVQMFNLQAGEGGGVQFFGFVLDPGDSGVSSISLVETPTNSTGSTDYWGIDDIRVKPVPEPSSTALFALASLLVTRSVRRRPRR
jgi:hypothetical protein